MAEAKSGGGGEAGGGAPKPDEAKAKAAAAARKRAKKRRQRLLGGAATVVVVTLASFVAMNMIVTRSANGYTYDDAPDVPQRTVAIVFGAFVHPDGHLSGSLADRVNGAVALYKAGRVSRLLMTGDNSRSDYDEVTAMRDEAVRQGVPAEAITRDYAGFDTYDSCVRAYQIFGVRDAVLVTQNYHLSRALFICRRQGIDAVGLAIPDWAHLPERVPTRYLKDQEVSYTLREWLARAKAFIEVEITRPEPRVSGPFEGLRAT